MIKVEGNNVRLTSPTRTLSYVRIGDCTLCFSYDTFIGFFDGVSAYITNLEYSPTTTKHKNMFAGTYPNAKFVSHAVFQQLTQEFLQPLLTSKEPVYEQC